MQKTNDFSHYPELAGKGKLLVERDRVNGSWKIRLPKLPWRSAAANEERNSLLARLGREFPVVALWSPREGDLDNPFAWTFPSVSQLPKLVESLYEGGWALLFFKESPGARLQSITKIPTDAENLKELLARLSGCAAISSWYDDLEWILIILRS